MSKTNEVQDRYLRGIYVNYPFSKKITPTMILNKKREIDEHLMKHFPREYESREIKFPNIYSTWAIPAENYRVEYPDYHSMKIVPVEDVTDEREEQYSDVLYWEAVHDGDINPDEENDDYDGHDEDTDYRLDPKKMDKYKTIQQVRYLLNSNISDEDKAKVLIHIAGVGVQEYDEIAHARLKEIIFGKMEKIGKDKGLKVNKSAYKIWLEDTNKNRFLSIHFGRFPADVFDDKKLEFHEGATKEKMEYAILLLKLMGYEFNNRITELLLSEEFISRPSWSNFNEREKYKAIENFLYIDWSDHILTINLAGACGVQSY